MKQRINAYLFNNGHSSNIFTAYYLLAIIERDPKQTTVTTLCKKLGINRSYYYKLYNKHKTFIEMIKSENENEIKSQG
jgi:ACT domain-containing protein